QVAFGAVLDTVKIVKLVRTLMRSGSQAIQAASKTAHALTYAGEVVGAGFMAANVVLDSIQLANAENDAQRAVFGTQLAFDATGLVLSGAGIGISITADVATAVGATAVATAAGTAGAILGGVGVIVAGLGIGAAALAQNYAAIAQKADAIGTYFKAIDDGYAGNGFEYRENGGNPILVARSGAVVTEVDFRANRVHFGNQYISQTTHGPSGSGKINYFFWASDIPQENEDAQLNIRTELGYADSVSLIAPNTNMVVLPGTPEVHMSDLSWQTLPGATSRYDAGFEVLRRLENNYLFDYDFYVFPSEYILHEINEVAYRTTTVNVKLDAQSRTLVMPDFPDEHSGHIHYEFYGQGGEYVVALNEGSWLTLHDEGDAPSTWILDTTNLQYQGAHFQYGNLRVGGYLVVPPPGHQNQILVVNHARDIFSVDTATRTVNLVSVDAAARGEGLLTYLSGLTFPGRFMEVTNYEVGGRSIGNAWYDKDDQVIRYVDLGSASMTANLQLLDLVDGKLIFSAAKNGKLEIWEVDPTTHLLGNRYAMVASSDGDTSRLSRVWHDGNQILFEQTQTGTSGTIVRRYRLTDQGLKLSTVMGDASLVTQFSTGDALAVNWTFHLLPQVVHLISWDQDSSGATLRTGRFRSTGVDAWVTIISDTRRVWIHRDTREVVIPGMETIPDDLQIVGLDTEGGLDIALFYSESDQTVYRQQGRGDDQTIDAYGQIQRLYSMGEHPIFETLTGELRRLESSGDTQLTGVTQSWLEAHPNRDVVARPDLVHLAQHTSHDANRPENLPETPERVEHHTWRRDIRDLVAREGIHADPILVIQGLSDGDGNTVAGWYDVNADRFVLAQAPSAGSFIYLGLTANGERALLYDQVGRQLFFTTLLDDAALALVFGDDHILEDHAVLPALFDVFEGTGLTLSNLVPHDGNQYLAVTT
ncbi:MAG: hypothetical protein MI742_07590, partial [Desulfobacterales bacterium]|nr:hypothetical protein [Desulfobacterales bacterium]